MVDISNAQIAGLSGSWITGSIGGGQLPPPTGVGAGGGGGGSGLVGVTLGSNIISKGFSAGLFGSVDNDAPNPPVPPGIQLRQLVQLIGLNWGIQFTPGNTPGPAIPQNAWTSLTLTGGAGPIVLLSAAATYSTTATTTVWNFGATVDVWFSLADSTVVTATFA